MPVYHHAESDCTFVASADEPGLFDPDVVEVAAHELPARAVIDCSLSHSTVMPDLDFETYSEAGYWYDEAAEKWRFIEGVPKGTRNGLEAVGAAAYSEHPSTEVLSLAYNLKDGKGPRLWIPGMPAPQELFDHIARGGLLEAWNSAFEWYIWNNVCTRMGWPQLPYTLLRDAMAKARAFSLPGKLGEADKALGVTEGKIEDGTRLLNKFSKPRQPTKHDKRLRLDPRYDAQDGPKLYEYNVSDIKAESAVSAECPDLSPRELNLWLLDQRINFRGVNIDQKALADCKEIVRQAHHRYTEELAEITGGAVKSASEVQKIGGWLAAKGVQIPNLQAETVEQWLNEWTDGPEDARRVLEIRASLGAASVKKLYAIDRRLSHDGRLRDLFAFCGADRTGRFCIAEGGPVLVQDPQGRVFESPIEQVQSDWVLWDGQEWVRHEGVVYSGVKDVIEHDGICATPDHRVYTSTSEYTTLAELKHSNGRAFRGEKPCPTPSTASPHPTGKAT